MVAGIIQAMASRFYAIKHRERPIEAPLPHVQQWYSHAEAFASYKPEGGGHFRAKSAGQSLLPIVFQAQFLVKPPRTMLSTTTECEEHGITLELVRINTGLDTA
jgi:hypothetical protein